MNKSTLFKQAIVSGPIEYYHSKSISVPFPNTLDRLGSTLRFMPHFAGFGELTAAERVQAWLMIGC